MTIYTLNIYQLILPDGRKRTRKTTKTNPEYGTVIGTEYRLVADPGKVLTDGRTVTTCIDTATPEQWTEIDEPQPTPEPEGETND